MTMPLFHSAIAFTDFEKFLNEIGLGSLRQEQKDEIALRARHMAASMVVAKMIRSIQPDKQEELAKLMEEAEQTGNHSKVNSFFLEHIPDIQAIVKDSVDEVKELLRGGLANAPEIIAQHLGFFDAANQTSNEQPNEPMPAEIREATNNESDSSTPPANPVGQQPPLAPQMPPIPPSGPSNG